MVFPGVLRGRPGPRLATTPTSRPRRSLSSPGMYYPSSVAAPCVADPGRRNKGRTRTRPRNKSDAVPGRLRNPFWSSPKALPRSGPKAFPHGWRGLTPQWPRSLRLGSASSSKVAPTPTDCNPPQHLHPAHSEKKRHAPPCPSVGSRHLGLETPNRRIAAAICTLVRRRLSVLPQWTHG
jgi:hypothetical protein